MGSFDGFDTTKVAALQKAVAGLETSASTIASSIATTSVRASDLITTGYGVSPQLTRANPAESYDTDPDRAGLTTVTKAAPGVASEIQRRLTHLLACEKIVQDGYPIDIDVVFDDEAPPDEQKIKDALGSVPGDLDHFYDGAKDDDFINTLAGLNSAELDAVIGSLSDQDLEKMGMAVSTKEIASVDGMPYGMSNSQKVKLANLLLANLGATQLARVQATVPLQPNVDVGVKGVSWTTGYGTLYGADGKATIGQINQGADGDCWFLASIGAELEKNPDFVQQHIHENANGTYTVTFYDDGKPVDITVDSSLPTTSDGSNLPFAHGDGDRNPNIDPTWIAIYEKAYAQMQGGYHAIEGGWGSEGMSALTGQSSDKTSPGDLSISQMQALFDQGHPITVGSTSHTTGHLWWTHHHETFDVDGQTLVSSHEYTVVQFGSEGNGHPGEVELRNPWGVDSGVPEYVWVDQDDLKSNFGEVSVGND